MRNWDLSRGHKIYFNLHKKCYSVQAWDTDKKGWRLYKHSNALHVKDVSMQVNEKGRQRVIKEKRKNVHAFLNVHTADCIGSGRGKETKGDIANYLLKVSQPSRKFRGVCKYNPYEHDSFVDHETKAPIHELDEAVLRFGLVFYEKK